MQLIRSVYILLLSSSLVSSFQFPFDTKSLFNFHTIQDGDIYRHYTTVPEDQLPINLYQYHEDFVIRVDYSHNQELKKFIFATKSTNEDQNQSKVTFNKWGKNNHANNIDLQISEENLIRLIEKFPTINYKIIIEDLAQKVYETYPKNHHESINTASSDSKYKFKATEEIIAESKVNVLSELFFKEYRPLETIEAWLDILKQTYPDLISFEDIGHTYEHRTYRVVHFSVPNSDIEHHERKTIVVTGGVHAREWVSVSSVLYTIYSLILHYNENPTSKILSNLDFLFIPISNPDGYEYSWNTDRLWRKNRQETVFPNCFGIDIDHSFDFHWTKSSDWACGEEYSGELPFEAFESQIWEEYLNHTNNDHKIWGYIDLHSYSQEVLYPYAYSCSEQPRDEENLIELAYGIAKSIRLQSGKTYNVLPACIDKDVDLLPDLGSGSGLDFMYHNRAYWAYQLKLRDSGSHGFLLPGKYIEPVGKEIFAGIKYFCLFILNDE